MNCDAQIKIEKMSEKKEIKKRIYRHRNYDFHSYYDTIKKNLSVMNSTLLKKDYQRLREHVTDVSSRR